MSIVYGVAVILLHWIAILWRLKKFNTRDDHERTIGQKVNVLLVGGICPLFSNCLEANVICVSGSHRINQFGHISLWRFFRNVMRRLRLVFAHKPDYAICQSNACSSVSPERCFCGFREMIRCLPSQFRMSPSSPPFSHLFQQSLTSTLHIGNFLGSIGWKYKRPISGECNLILYIELSSQFSTSTGKVSHEI